MSNETMIESRAILDIDFLMSEGDVRGLWFGDLFIKVRVCGVPIEFAYQEVDASIPIVSRYVLGHLGQTCLIAQLGECSFKVWQ